jgi:DNA (cytosine-5)-methyltransferase 1
VKLKNIYAADVFSGCGGLSLGLRRGGLSVRVAVDNEPAVKATYARNHAKTHLIIADVREVSGKRLLKKIPGGKLHVLAGCAPCQGFSSLTHKQKREDPRNELVLEMARLVEETNPEIVVMENVPGLAARGRALLDEFIRRLRALGYYANWDILQMADFGVPQNRRRLVLAAGKGFFVALPQPTHARIPEGQMKKWISVRQAIGEFGAPRKFGEALKTGGPQSVNWHVVRDLEEITRKRLKAAIPGKTWKLVPEALRPKCHQGDYGGFTNVYQRMTWEQLSVTMTGGCTVPAKGRFGHPDRRRTTISVREAATLQTFPKKYRFVHDGIDKVCDMIGNAVPPTFAEHLGRRVAEALRQHMNEIERSLPRRHSLATA